MTDHEIDSRLRSVEQLLSSINTQLTDHLTQQRAINTRHEDTLFGGPKVRGMQTRVDRLERMDDWRRWSLRAIWGVILSGVGSFGWTLLKK